jgi:hypothetical protein
VKHPRTHPCLTSGRAICSRAASRRSRPSWWGHDWIVAKRQELFLAPDAILAASAIGARPVDKELEPAVVGELGQPLGGLALRTTVSVSAMGVSLPPGTWGTPKAPDSSGRAVALAEPSRNKKAGSYEGFGILRDCLERRYGALGGI